MSNAGQAVLSVAGAAVGFWLGGPAGAAWGFSLGGMAGSALFPTDLGTISGPRLNDLSVQTSTVGAPIPIVYGTYAIAGNLIWSSGIIETVSRKKQGGKGGPTQTVKTYTYKVNCAVGVCEGEIGGISRIWADAKLIYDARPQLPDETSTEYSARVAANAALLANTEIYLGTDAQLADTTIESFEGLGNVSAFRDLAYVVFSEFQLADYGNRVPNFRFEVLSAAVMEEVCVGEVSGPVIHPWLDSGVDPRNPLNNHEYRIYNGAVDSYNAPGRTYADNWTIFYNFHNAGGFGRNNNPLVDSILGWSLSDGDNQMDPIGPVDFTDGYDALDLHLWYAASAPTAAYAKLVSGSISSVFADIGAGAGLVYHSSSRVPGSGHGIYYRGASGGLPAFNTPASGPYYFPSVSLSSGEAGAAWNDESLVVRRLPGPPAGDGWSLISGTAKALSVYNLANNEMGGFKVQTLSSVAGYYNTPDLKIQFRVNGILRIPSQAEYNDQAWWESQYAAAVTAGTQPSGKTYGVHYPVTVGEYYSREVCTEEISAPEGSTTLGIIVADVCRRCGLTSAQIDVSDLTEAVDGYVVTRVMSGRDAISPLRSFGFFDCVESDGRLKWPTRGKAAVVNLTTDDLAAHIAGDQRPSSVETDRQQEVELPRRLRVHYAQNAQNYEPGEQSASRLAAGDVEVRDLEVAIAMSDAKAAQIAEVVLYDLWTSRNRHRVVLDQSMLPLEPADAITVPVDGRQQRMRVLELDLQLPGVIRASLVADDDGAYESYVIGAPAAYAGTNGGAIAATATASVVLLDLPRLRDADTDAGYYAAPYSPDDNWSCAAVYRSSDGGTTYDLVAEAGLSAIVGSIVADVDPPGSPSQILDGSPLLFDEVTEIVVDLNRSDELSSIGEATLVAGDNLAAIGADGRWEIIQFRDAVLLGSPGQWVLSGLWRGLFGTDAYTGTTVAGDKFVLLSDAGLLRIAETHRAIGFEKLFKTVACGSSLDATTAIAFTTQGHSYRDGTLGSLPDVDVAGALDGDVLTFDNATQTWIPGAGGGGDVATDVIWDAAGDLAVGTGANTAVRLAAGSENHVLTIVGGEPAWAAPGAGAGLVEPDTPPTSPNALDDEFNGTSIDAKWVRNTSISGGSCTVAVGSGILRITTGATGDPHCYGQAISGNFKVRAKIGMLTTTIGSAYANFQQCGLYVYRSTGTKRISFHLLSNLNLEIGRWTAVTFNTATAYGANMVKRDFESFIYVEMEYDGTNIISRVSRTGHEGTFFQVASETAASHLGGAPTEVGLMANASSATAVMLTCDWFRRIS
jgi:hypothetical protein